VKRRIFSLASLLSLLLCGATVVMWARSYFVADQFSYCTASETRCRCYDCFLVTSRGQVAFNCTIRQMDMQEALGMVLKEMQKMGSRPGLSWFAARPARSLQPGGTDSFSRLGFLWETRNDVRPIVAITNSAGEHILAGLPTRARVVKPLGKIAFSGFHFRLPFWFIFVLLIPPSLPSVFRQCRRWLIRAKRAKRGRCLACGYNLTGNTSGACPECGTPIPSSTVTPEPKSPRPA
jgi:hypothetical protein